MIRKPPPSPKAQPAREPDGGAQQAATYRLDDQIGYRLRLAMQRHTDLFFRNMAGGLTQPQFAAMARLHANGPCSQNQLGRSIALDSASIVGVVTRLKAQHLISTVKDRQDRRRVVIDLTPQGRALMSQAIARGQQANDLTLAPLSAEERRTLIRILRKMAPGEDETDG